MKNMFTKILAGLLSVCAILSFGACGDGEGSNKVKMINVPLSAESYGVAVAKGEPSFTGYGKYRFSRKSNGNHCND